MAIEIRQLSVRCRIVMPPPSPRLQRNEDVRVLKEQLFAQCRAWLRDELRRAKER